MKKAMALILALVMCLSLCACGEKENTTVDTANTATYPGVQVFEGGTDLAAYLGDWHCADTQQVLTIKLTGFELFSYDPSDPQMGSALPPQLDGNTMTFDALGAFTIDGDTLTCNETRVIPADTTFVKEEASITLKEIASHDWINPATGDTLTFTATNGIELIFSGGGSMGGDEMFTKVVGNTIYMFGVDVFQIEGEGDSIKLVGKVGEFVINE